MKLSAAILTEESLRSQARMKQDITKTTSFLIPKGLSKYKLDMLSRHTYFNPK